MLKELFESSFYMTYPHDENVLPNVTETIYVGSFALVDPSACVGCRDICNPNPMQRQQLRLFTSTDVHAVKMDDVLKYVKDNLGEHCDYILDNGHKFCLVEMTCANDVHVGSKRLKSRSQLFNSISSLRACYAIREHIDAAEQCYVVFSWRKTEVGDENDPVEKTMLKMIAVSDEIYSPDNESNFDNTFKYKEIRYPDVYLY